MLSALQQGKNLAVGTKQVLRAIQEDKVAKAYVAKDADPFLTKRVMDACYAKNILCLEAENMKALGEACHIEVGTAAAALLKG